MAWRQPVSFADLGQAQHRCEVPGLLEVPQGFVAVIVEYPTVEFLLMRRKMPGLLKAAMA